MKLAPPNLAYKTRSEQAKRGNVPPNRGSKSCNDCNYLLESCLKEADISIKPMKSSGTVSALLHHKGSEVWSVPPETTVFEAIKLMAEKNIGALLDMAGGKSG